MNNDDTFHDELTAHLATQVHPLPHPHSYVFGYKSREARLRDFGLTDLPQPTRPLSHPGPVTMYERNRWMGRVLDWLPFVVGFAVFAWWALHD